MDQPDLIPEIIIPIRGKHTGKAPQIRQLKSRYPEMSTGKIAQRVGTSEFNVRQVLNKWLCDTGEVDEYIENRADIFAGLQTRLLKTITNEEITKMQVYPRVVAAGILHEHERWERGQTTNISMTVMVDLLEAVREMNK